MHNATKLNNAQWRCTKSGQCNPPVDVCQHGACQGSPGRCSTNMYARYVDLEMGSGVATAEGVCLSRKRSAQQIRRQGGVAHMRETASVGDSLDLVPAGSASENL
jgi:hypothetical protein